MVNELLKSRLLKEISNPSELEIFKDESTFLLSIKTDDADEDLDTMVSSKEIEVLSVIIVGFWEGSPHLLMTHLLHNSILKT